MRRALSQARRDGILRWGTDFIDLGRSEPLAAWPPDEEVGRAMAVGRPTRGYPPVEGGPQARAAAAGYYSRLLGRKLIPEQVLITPGALVGLSLALATLCRPGDPVAVAVPYYHAHPSLVELAGGEILRVETTDGGRLTSAALGAVRPPGAVLFANPANPTGVAYNRQHLEDLTGCLPAGTAVIADEVYAEYVYDRADFASVASVLCASDARDWLVVRSASKTLGRPGLRIGVVLGSPALIEAVADVAAAMTGAASVPAQLAFAAGLAAVDGAEHVRPYRRRLDVALAACRRHGLSTLRPQGTYYLWVNGPGVGAVDTAARLSLDAGVFAWPGVYFGSPSHMRITLAVPVAALEEGIGRIAGHLTGRNERWQASCFSTPAPT